MFDGKFFCQISIIFVTVLTSWTVSETVRNLQPIQVKTAKDLFQWSPHSWGFVWLSVRYCAVRTDIGRHVGHNSIDWPLELTVICSFFLWGLGEISILRPINTDAQTFSRVVRNNFLDLLYSPVLWYHFLCVLHQCLKVNQKSPSNSWLEQHLTFLQLMFVSVTLFLDSFLPLLQ